MASNQEIQKIIDATDIVALVSRYMKLEKQGKNYRGLCPFHNENTPSFIVSPEKKVAHCFGCGGGGNPINFLMQIENIDFSSAIAKLAEINGIEYSGYVEDKKINPLTKYFKIMQTAANFYKKYFENTKEGKEALEYLYKRGLDDETIKMFNIGLSPNQGNTLYKVLKESNYLELDMTDVGLVDKNSTGYFDLFSNRIMFPICDEVGNVLGFSARIFNGLDKNQPKYINSRETLLYKKADVLFNLHIAKKDIMRKKRVILHEGQMDVIASYKSGLKEAICTMGTALSVSQAKVLLKYTKHAVICYDGDKAGINASYKAIRVFKSLGFIVHLVLLPNGMDPDDYVLKNGSEAYLDFFENNMIDANQYIFETTLLNKNLEDSTVVEAVKTQIFEMLLTINSKTEEEDYIKKLAKALNSSVEALSDDYSNYYKTHQRSNYVENSPYDEFNEIIQHKGVKEPKEVNKLHNMYELRLFMYAKASKSKALYIDKQLEMYGGINVMSYESQSLWVSLYDYYENFDVFDEGKFISSLEQHKVEYYLSILDILRKDKNRYTDDDLNQCLEKLKEVKINKDNKDLSKKVQNSTDITEQSRLLDQIFENKRKKEQLKNIRRK